MSKKAKEFIESAVITFLTGFFLILSTQIDTITLESLKDGTLVGLLLAAVRFGLKLAIQGFLEMVRNMRNNGG